jgi:hypothetical protein
VSASVTVRATGTVLSASMSLHRIAREQASVS